MKIDKQNGDVAFIESTHEYFNVKNPQEKYISVTTLIHKFTQEIDKDFWSAYKALEKLLPKESWAIEKKSLLNTKRFNRSILELYDIADNAFNEAQQEILDTWDEKNRQACERGTRIHAELENSYYKNPSNISLKRYGIGGKFECKKGRTELDLEYGVYPEYLVYWNTSDKVLRLAGQIDLLIKNGNEITIVDYKTNEKIDQKSFFNTKTKSSVKMKYPLNNLDDANFYHYTLQLSTYAWMLQKINPEFIIKDLIIVHFDHSGNEVTYHCDYLKKEVERMLAYHKKQILLEIERSKRKPIEY